MFILSYPSSDSIFLKDEISFVNAFRSRLELTEFKSMYPIDSETRKRGLQRKKFYFFFFLDRLFFTIESPARLYLTSVTGHPVCRGNAASFPFNFIDLIRSEKRDQSEELVRGSIGFSSLDSQLTADLSYSREKLAVVRSPVRFPRVVLFNFDRTKLGRPR